jgi:hypothetical protein
MKRRIALLVVALIAVGVYPFMKGEASGNNIEKLREGLNPAIRIPPEDEPFDLTAADPVVRGREVVRKWDHWDYGYGDMKAEYELINTDKEGRTSKRRMRLRMLETSGYDENGDKTDGDKSLVEFTYPPDIKGTTVLIHAHIDRPDDTWVYLPALKRVKRISSANLSGKFAGTEFAYEDIASQELKKFTYKWLRGEQLGEGAENCETNVVEQFPTYKNSGYIRQISWYNKAACQQKRIDYYSHQDVLVKTQTFQNYKQYLGRYWRGHDIKMVNHVTGKSSHLLIPEFTYRNGFSERDFEASKLKMMR